MKLTNNQKKFLRARGHSLKPVVMVGKHGLSESVVVSAALIAILSAIDRYFLGKIICGSSSNAR
jgi:hypothetical protein